MRTKIPTGPYPTPSPIHQSINEQSVPTPPRTLVLNSFIRQIFLGTPPFKLFPVVSKKRIMTFTPGRGKCRAIPAKISHIQSTLDSAMGEPLPVLGYCVSTISLPSPNFSLGNEPGHSRCTYISPLSLILMPSLIRNVVPKIQRFAYKRLGIGRSRRATFAETDHSLGWLTTGSAPASVFCSLTEYLIVT